jgi:hypothetical protein
MSKSDFYVQAVEVIYASGADSGRVPDALEAINRLLGGLGATLEVIDKATQRPIEFHSAGLPSPAGARYFDHFAALNPRISPGLRQRSGEVGFDYQLLDEPAMAQDAFYSEFLPELDLRYFISAVVEQTPDRLVAVSVQRTRRQGHVDAEEISLMQRLCPHVRNRASAQGRSHRSCQRSAAKVCGART